MSVRFIVAARAWPKESRYSQRMERLSLRLSWAFCGITVLGACGDAKPQGAGALDAGASLSAADADAGNAADPAPFVCDVTAPSSCPEPAPTYATVEPILERRCIPCHDGRGAEWPLTTYDSAADWYDTIRTMMLDCSMPPLDAGMPMPTSEREQLLTWIRCGYPE
jgi:hypothetical protein